MRLSGLLNVMRCDDNRFLTRLRNLHQVIPNTLTQQRIHSDRRFVQNEQLRIVHQRHGKWDTSLLATAQILDHSILRRQIQKVEKELQTLHDVIGFHTEDPAEIHHRLFDGELRVESDFLGHVANPFAGNTRSWK